MGPSQAAPYRGSPPENLALPPHCADAWLLSVALCCQQHLAAKSILLPTAPFCQQDPAANSDLQLPGRLYRGPRGAAQHARCGQDASSGVWNFKRLQNSKTSNDGGRADLPGSAAVGGGSGRLYRGPRGGAQHVRCGQGASSGVWNFGRPKNSTASNDGGRTDLPESAGPAGLVGAGGGSGRLYRRLQGATQNVWCGQGAAVLAPFSRHSRAILAPFSRRFRTILAPFSRRFRAVFAPFSRRFRAVLTPFSRRSHAVFAPFSRCFCAVFAPFSSRFRVVFAPFFAPFSCHSCAILAPFSRRFRAGFVPFSCCFRAIFAPFSRRFHTVFAPFSRRPCTVFTPFLRRFRAIFAPFSRHFRAIFAPFSRHFHAIFTPFSCCFWEPKFCTS